MAIKHPVLKSGKAAPFPKDELPLAQKEKKPFGVQIAQAIWGYASQWDSHLFWNDREKYYRYKQYALGAQDEGQYKPLLHEDKDTEAKGWLKAINFNIKNYATKRINITVSKLHSKNYDPIVEMNDPLSKGMTQNIRMALELKMKNKKAYEEMQRTFGDMIDLDSIPNDAEELQIIMDNDFKMVEAVHLEKAIPHHLEKNKWERQRRMVDFDLAVLGVGAVHVGMDENMRPRIERWNPADIIAPYNDKPTFDQLPFIAGVKWVTIAEFRKMAMHQMSEKKMQDIIDEFGKKNMDSTDYNSQYDPRRYDNVTKIALLKYNYRSTDTVVYLEKTDEFGNRQAFEKPIDYYAKPKEQERFQKKYGNTRKLHRLSVNAVYEGWWVIGSDEVFDHHRRAYSTDQFGTFNNSGMGFKIFAPNSWDGMVTSMGGQMIPVLDELQRYNLKIQQLVARAIPKGVGIDLYALRKANLKWGGKGMSDQQKIEMYMKSGIFVFSSKDRYAPGSNYKPFYEVENGLANDIEKYLRLVQNAVLELDEIIGINKVVAASNVREDAGKAVTEMQVGAAEVALDYLYNADKEVYKDIVEEVGILHVKSYLYNKKNRMIYDQMFGTGLVQSQVRFDLFDFSFDIEVRPSDAEWREIYVSAEKAYDKGILKYSDTLYLREFKSIKQARLWLMMKERQFEQKSAEQQQAQIEANAQVQQQSLMAKSQADQALEDKKLANGVALEAERRKTIEFEANVDINKLKRISVVEAELDRRENAQEGKIKDRHIILKGEIDKEIAGMRGKAKETGKESKTSLDKK